MLLIVMHCHYTCLLLYQASSDLEKVTLKPQELPEEELDETQTAEWRQRKKHIFILSESGLSTQGESAK